METTLVIIKPDGVKRGLVGTIIQRFERKQLVMRQVTIYTLSRQLAEEHYQHVKAFDFFDEMIQYMTASDCVFLVLEGENAVQVVRKMVGATNALAAEPGTIRGDYGSGHFQNVIHASDSPETAKIEIQRFFGEL